jgi:uncharacterized protein YgbK (DUF1537 family)
MLSPDQAAERVAAVTRKAVAAKPAWIFKKCDSVLRGPVLAEARAAAEAAGKKRLLLLPANPSRNRIIRAGLYLIDGQPLHETDFKHDPIHSRITSHVAELLGPDLTGVEIPDIANAAEIARHAATMDRDMLPVGAVDFFTALLHARVKKRKSPPVADARSRLGPELIVCGSMASWSQRRTEATRHGIPVFTRPYDLAGVSRELQASSRALIGIGDVPASPEITSAFLTADLADAVATVVLDAGPIDRLLLEGGATARAIVDRLGWIRLQVCQLSTPGVAVLRPIERTGPLLFIKPGSYGWPTNIWPG